ncbi:hypothetical protein C2E23DRAFT_862372 [Lenzites betulinus]|nr:hypothetical protein C2E23DRAFT_862372 [Lenzites betulinus]
MPREPSICKRMASEGIKMQLDFCTNRTLARETENGAFSMTTMIYACYVRINAENIPSKTYPLLHHSMSRRGNIIGSKAHWQQIKAIHTVFLQRAIQGQPLQHMACSGGSTTRVAFGTLEKRNLENRMGNGGARAVPVRGGREMEGPLTIYGRQVREGARALGVGAVRDSVQGTPNAARGGIPDGRERPQTIVQTFA